MVYNVLVVDFSLQVNYTTKKRLLSRFFEMAVLFFLQRRLQLIRNIISFSAVHLTGDGSKSRG